MKNVCFCNKCGKEISINPGVDMKDCLKVVKDWGYFSKKDLQTHEFVICESCYDAMIEEFVIPVKKSLRNEAV